MPNAPDSTAVRVALWRALHVEADAPPHVLTDTIGAELADAGEDWRNRPDMDPQFTRLFRPSMVARARFIEDLVTDRAAQGISQYVILGAGLDTFAQRRPEAASRLRIFEIDRLEPQAWKRQRLMELGYGVPDWLRFVPVDFEAGEDWLTRLKNEGFDVGRPAVLAATGLCMYLSKNANGELLRKIAALAPGSTLAMSYILPLEQADDAERPGLEMAVRGAQASGTPFLSFFTGAELVDMGLAAGFKQAWHVTAADLAERYFAGRTDGLRPSKSEELLVALT